MTSDNPLGVLDEPVRRQLGDGADDHEDGHEPGRHGQADLEGAQHRGALGAGAQVLHAEEVHEVRRQQHEAARVDRGEQAGGERGRQPSRRGAITATCVLISSSSLSAVEHAGLFHDRSVGVDEQGLRPGGDADRRGRARRSGRSSSSYCTPLSRANASSVVRRRQASRSRRSAPGRRARRARQRTPGSSFLHGAHVEYQKLTTSGLPTRSAVAKSSPASVCTSTCGKRFAGHGGVGADRRREVVARRQRDVVVVGRRAESSRLAATMPTATTTTAATANEPNSSRLLTAHRQLKATEGPPPAIVGGIRWQGALGAQSGGRAKRCPGPPISPPGGGDRRVDVVRQPGAGGWAPRRSPPPGGGSWVDGRVVAC